MPEAEERPFLIMIAGPNGSGKSTLTQHLIDQGADFGEYINPDEIASTLSDEASDERSKDAQKIAHERREAALNERRSFSFETVMSHPSKIEILQRARDSGYDVALYFVGVNGPGISVKRVAIRVGKGGHDVPPERVIARYARTMEGLLGAVRVAHKAFIFDNSGSDPNGSSSLRPVVSTESDGRDIRVVRKKGRMPAWVNRHLLQRLT